MLLERIIWGTILAVIGIIIVMKTDWILQMFGRFMWAELHLGSSGGSRLFYKFVGIIFIFIGFLIIMGLTVGFIKFLLSPFYNF